MAGVWIQLNTARSIHYPDGSVANKLPGDFVQIGKAQAREWLADGSASIPDERKHRSVVGGDLRGCGISVRGAGVDVHTIIGAYTMGVASEGVALPFDRTLIWHPDLPLMPDQTAHGFAKLEKTDEFDTWDMAVMLCPGDMTMAMVGSEKDREGTLKLVGTLDIPAYESRAVWVRRNGNTRKMADAWRNAVAKGIDDTHAFLRALYATPLLLICTLPPTWMRNWYEEEQQVLQRRLRADRARKRVKGRMIQARK